MNKGMKSHNKKKIVDFLKKNKLANSSELAQYLNVSWNTAEKYLLELVIEKKVTKIKKAKSNIWMLK